MSVIFELKCNFPLYQMSMYPKISNENFRESDLFMYIYTRPMIGTVYFVSGRSISIVSPDKRTWSYKGKGFTVGDTVSCVVSNNGTSKTVDDYIKSAVVSEGQPIEIEAAEEGALVHFASETYYLERRY